jgi:hypothetical protein
MGIFSCYRSQLQLLLPSWREFRVKLPSMLDLSTLAAIIISSKSPSFVIPQIGNEILSKSEKSQNTAG